MIQTEKLQEALKKCGWTDAALLRQQDVSEAFTFITDALDHPLLTLKMDVYHPGKEDNDDHRIVKERLLDVAIPNPPEDGSVIRLEDCLESYFNNKVEVKRHLQRRNTIQSFRSMDKGQVIVTESTDSRPGSPASMSACTIPFDVLRLVLTKARQQIAFLIIGELRMVSLRNIKPVMTSWYVAH